MAQYIYIDYSNLYLSRGASSVHVYHGNERIEEPLPQSHYSFDFVKLYQVLTGSGGTIARCLLVGSVSFGEELLPSLAAKAGFEPIFYSRRVHRHEKKVDVAIAAQMIKDAYTKGNPREDLLTLVSGDSDFVPVVEMLTRDGYPVEVCFWRTASHDLKQSATVFTSLQLDLINLERIPTSPINSIEWGATQQFKLNL